MTASPPKLSFPPFYHRAYVEACSEHGDRNLRWPIYYDRLRWAIKNPPQSGTSFTAAAAFERLHTSDVYIACAATRGEGCERFLELYQRYMFKQACQISGSVDLGSEIADEVLAGLFTVNNRQQVRLDTYAGWGPLAGWLRAVVVHAAYKEARHQSELFECLDDLPEQPDMAPVLQLEARLRDRTYHDSIIAALLAGLRQLTRRQRQVLRLCYEQAIEARRAAEIIGVSASTVSREAAKAMKRIKEITLGQLVLRWGGNHGDVDECLREILENPNYPLLELLRQADLE